MVVIVIIVAFICLFISFTSLLKKCSYCDRLRLYPNDKVVNLASHCVTEDQLVTISASPHTLRTFNRSKNTANFFNTRVLYSLFRAMSSIILIIVITFWPIVISQGINICKYTRNRLTYVRPKARYAGLQFT